ncbi:MAG TPA: hypothetical protein ENN67_02835, partial [Firmicutes bacterium]|nr:hypothetical protein [Bacillota bacterium]
PGGIRAEINAIHLETQSGLLPGNIATFSGPSLDSAFVGQDSISATYNLEVLNPDPKSAGEFPVLIVIESADPFSYDQDFPGFVFPAGLLSAYFKASVTVSGEAPPFVNSINPKNGVIDTELSDVEITGTNFATGAQVTLIKSDDPGVVLEAANEVVSGGGTEITCDFDLNSSAGAELGKYHVRVTNPSSLYGQLNEGFEIKPPATDPYWWECIMYNSSRTGRNPIATTPDPTSLTLAFASSVAVGMKFCTPVVAENKIFFTANSGFYASTGSRVYCHSLETGAQIWNAQINPSNAYIRFMPGFAFYDAGDGTERLIVGGDQIYCFDANSTGTNPTPLWTYDDLDPTDQNWLGTQLTVYDGKVLAKGRSSTALYILDAKTGSLIHKVPIQGGFESGVSGKDGKAYTLGYSYATYLTYLECIDIETGTIDWTATNTYSSSHWSGPCVGDGRIYFSCYQGRVFCYATEAQGSYSPGDLIWYYQTAQGNPLNGGVAKLGDDLYFGAAFTGNPIYCITDNGDSASLKWTSSVTGYWDGHTVVTTTPSYPDGVVIAAETNSGILYFFNAVNGSVIHSIATSEQQRGGAALAGDYVVIVGGANVRAYK